jgi:nucleotide-binding universal stress UspA family protein
MTLWGAILDFRRARRRAERERLVARLTGKSADLLSYEQVRQMLKAKTGQQVGLKDIPLDAIAGSVGRYSDFTRSFLPLQSEYEQRWARIQTKYQGMEGLPPIDVYQLGDAYFVIDGNHRVSVARQMGATHIQAYVTEIDSRVSLEPDVQPDKLILKAEYATFLELTRLDELRPAADLTMTAPGQYRILLEHIEIHRYFMGLEQQEGIDYEQAVTHWYDTIYRPVIDVIREQDVLRAFPGRRETDLYVWISKHRTELENALDWEIKTEAATADLVEQFSPRAQRRLARLAEKLVHAVTPHELESGPATGTWRRERLALRHDDCLFADILVLVSGHERGWEAVAQATEIACREEARLLGLHVVHSEAEAESERVQALQAEFSRHCQALGVSGRLAVDVGQVARKTCERAHWADLVVMGLSHPPAPQPLAKLGSGFRILVRRCPTPVLAVPGAFSPLKRPLLVYDGSPKAKEALYIATYLAARNQVPLVVITVVEGGYVTPDALAEAGEYLEARGIQATLVQEHGPVPDLILRAAEEYQCDLLLMGGYGHSPMFEVVLGSVVDEVLRSSWQPVLICR